MRRDRSSSHRIIAGLVAVLAMAAGRAAGEQAIERGESTANPTLLLIEGVQKELKLSDDQKGKVSTIVREFVEKRNKGFTELGQANLDVPEVRQKRVALTRELTVDAWSKLKAALSDVQLDRLRQLDLRHAGIFAFLNPAILTQLKTTEGQKRELRTICQIAIAERPTFRDFELAHPDATRELWLAAVEEVDERALARMITVLDPDQRKHWAELIGPEFRFRVGE